MVEESVDGFSPAACSEAVGALFTGFPFVHWCFMKLFRMGALMSGHASWKVWISAGSPITEWRRQVREQVAGSLPTTGMPRSVRGSDWRRVCRALDVSL